jgi:glycosyltransferase involved in cell wall biosynthesis
LPWDRLSVVAHIRYAGIAQHLHRLGRFDMERYRSWRSYDAVVFVKLMNDQAFAEAQRLKKRGTPVIFDANVNYYDISGDFPIPSLRPTPQQREQAIRMTELADVVVADSSYIRDMAAAWNPHTVWIPDAVDTERFMPGPARSGKEPLTLVWSGIGSKAVHLEVVEPVLDRLAFPWRLLLIPGKPDAKDVLAPVVTRLRRHSQVRIRYWGEEPYEKALRQADVIISPKKLTCSYDLGHTEYKITLGMSAGLPALASSQPSYRDTLADGKGGSICASEEEWEQALLRFAQDRAYLQEQSRLAREKVLARYSIPVVAAQYADVLDRVCKR